MSARLRVAVLGAGGRMGATVCEAVSADADLGLVAAVDPGRAGTPTAGGGPEIAGSLDAVAAAGAQVVVDFTAKDAALANLEWCASRRLHAVVGTTGFSPDDLVRVGEWYPAGGPAGCVVAPNFAIGAVLMMRLAELAAPWFDTAEVIELHHDAKADAPSGTAMLTARRVAAAGGPWAPDPTRTEVVAGARGGDVDGVRVHSVRLRGLVAHQEVLLGTTGQSLCIRHDSYDRRSFMPGVLLAVKSVASRPGVTVGLDDLLGL
jgi:4-hydroxy-tetrahydrodipicolinate reductase